MSWDRLGGFARMTDQIHRIPRQLHALPPGWRLMYPDGTEQNSESAFAVTEQHVGILARRMEPVSNRVCTRRTDEIDR
jgi:hypothetical protein